MNVHFPNVKKNLLDAALSQFFEVREVPGLKKKPSTSEMLDWLKLLLVEELDANDPEDGWKKYFTKTTWSASKK